ncbi:MULTISPECIES: restriction endonuclease [Marinobacter]|uniref:restriction endonuclease n=1 Tax=Marinobacter TaxID=2742 RepID=UPI00326644E6
MANNGREYEQFVGLLHQALLNAETLTEQRNIEVQRNKKILDSCGVWREFDIYWEYELAGITYKTVIECKDYNSKITLEKLDALIGKVRDIPDLKAVFATKKGYQSGAISKAEHNKIDLLVVREQNDSDWQDVDGTPFIKEVHSNVTIRMPANITNFRPLLDAAWAKDEMGIDVGSEFSMSGLNNEIFIENDDNGDSYSLHQLAGKLAPIGSSEHGEFKKEERFSSAWISGPDFRYKIKGYDVTYSLSEPHVEKIVIDFSKELVGVIEYLQKGTKKSIFRNGIIKEKLLSGNR